MRAPIAILVAALLALALVVRDHGGARETRPQAYARAAAHAERALPASWWGGRTTAGTGDAVTVYVSATYPEDAALVRRWADHFASLVHGSELASATIYVAPLAEVAALCRSDRALGCYANGRIVTIGEPVDGTDAAAVATHEYGHHVAQNRSNPPWSALDWGTKRWASAVGVCSRARSGSLFPGDEDHRYHLNPGEGFAEAYRVLNESRAGATTFGWDLVDQSLFPEAAALRALEDDVLRPWTAPRATTLRGRFVAGGPTRWARTVSTPLDGDLVVRLRVPPGAAHEVEVADAATGRVVARGLWSGTRDRTARYTVCGERTLSIRVTRSGRLGAFALTVTRP